VPYRAIDDPVKLRRLLEAILLFEADLELSTLLRHLIDEARSMTGARYGAIGVLNDERTSVVEFITVGLDKEEEERIGPRPTGKGILGMLIADPRPMRLASLGSQPESYGFPDHHPPMTSFLGVPIKVRGEVYGNLYLTDKTELAEFTSDDEALVEALALAAGIAVENTRLHQKVQDVAVYEDRDRLARELHDTVIQRLFAVGLSLQSMAAAAKSSGIAERLDSAISDLDDTIRQVRSTIYELGSFTREQGLRASILSLVRELDPVVGFSVQVSFDGPVDSAIPNELAEHLLPVVRETVTNIGRHARSTQASLSLSVSDGSCCLRVVDNGQGIDSTAVTEGGFGLVNLRRRADKLGGSLVIESPASGGTSVTWQVPLA
jgi:signal transduction histidine kinase